MDESALRSHLKNLEVLQSSLHWWLHFWEWIVIAGLIVDAVVIVKEFLDDRGDFRRGVIHTPEKPSVWLLVLGLFATGLILFGIARELSTDTKIEGVETQIRGVNEQLFGMVATETANAATSAKTAHQEADVTSKESDLIQKRLNTASEQLTVIEERVRAQGPRWLILANNAPEFIGDLKAFSGSRITVLICGGGVSPIEQLETEQRLLNMLGKSGSNWTAANWETGYEYWRECRNTSSNGLEMTIGGNASESLKNAAKALKDELLSLGIATSLHIVPPEQEQFWASLGADSPEARAARDPNTIFLLVAPNAMAESAKPTTK